MLSLWPPPSSPPKTAPATHTHTHDHGNKHSLNLKEAQSNESPCDSHDNDGSQHGQHSTHDNRDRGDGADTRNCGSSGYANVERGSGTQMQKSRGGVDGAGFPVFEPYCVNVLGDRVVRLLLANAVDSWDKLRQVCVCVCECVCVNVCVCVCVCMCFACVCK